MTPRTGALPPTIPPPEAFARTSSSSASRRSTRIASVRLMVPLVPSVFGHVDVEEPFDRSDVAAGRRKGDFEGAAAAQREARHGGCERGVAVAPAEVVAGQRDQI